MMRIQVHHLLPHPTCTATSKPLNNTHNTPKSERDEMQMIATIKDTRDPWWAQGKAH